MGVAFTLMTFGPYHIDKAASARNLQSDMAGVAILTLFVAVAAAEIAGDRLATDSPARKTLHPALSDLLIEAAQEVHGKSTIMQRAGQFPNPTARDFPIQR